MEAEIAALLPPTAARGTRAQLLASLAAYAGAAVCEARTRGAIVPGSLACTEALQWLLCPVFICGHHRSGTTLLQNLLDGHPQLLCLPSEGTYFSSFDYVARRTPTDHDMNRFAAEWISRFVDPNFAPHFRLGRSDQNRAPAVDFAHLLFGWHEALRSRVPPELAPLLALVAAYRASVAPTSAPRAWVEKTPRNERYVQRFAFFGAARFIQLVRHPRAVLASLSRLYDTAEIGPFDAAASARAIGQSLRLAEKNPPRLVDRYLIVRYEDLASQPAHEIERIRQFLGISPHAALSAPSAGGNPVAPNSAFGGGTAGVIGPAAPPAAVPSEHLALLGVYTAAAARAFGYEVPVPRYIARFGLRVRDWPRRMGRVARGVLRRALRDR